MSDEQKNTILRFALIFVIILLGFIAVWAKIIYIQTVDRDRWLQLAENQVPVIDTTRATRGNILDCHGRLLASSMPQYYVYMDTRVPALHQKNGALFVEQIDSLAHDLSVVTGERTASEYKKLIVNAYNRGNARLRLSQHRIDYLQKRQLEQNALIKRGKYKSGILFEPQHRRIYPYGMLASRTIGSIYGGDGYGIAGLEKRFERELRGSDGLSARQRIGGRTELVTIREAIDGLDIRTTLDADLQDLVETNLIATTSALEARWGCCILMEVETGEIKAIANIDRASDGSYYEGLNHAVLRVEPGSTFKTIALTAALDDDKVRINDTITVSRAPWQYMTVRHTDAHPRDTAYTVRSALAVSSNIALAKIITRSYEGSAKKFVNRIGKMGLLDSVYCEIPGSSRARIDVPKDTVTLSKMSYGYSVEMSPMQILMFYNAIANGGKMMRPMLVSAIEEDGETIERFRPETVKSSICSRSTLRDIQSALHDVVWDNKLGTASVDPWRQPKAQSQFVPIAGKTGTAQLLINGHYTGRRHRITFVGYFPEDKPQYSCICMIEDPKPPYDAGGNCGRTVRRIAEKTMAYTGCYVRNENDSLVLTRRER